MEDESAGLKNNTTENKPKFHVRILDHIIRSSLFMVFLGLPIFFTGLSFQGISFEKQIYFYFWTLLALVAWVAKGIITESIKIKRTPLDIPIVAFWLIYLLSTILSVDKWHSFWGFFGDPSRGFMSVTAIIIFYYLFLSNFNERFFRWVLGAIIASGSILSIWTALGILGAQFLPGDLEKIAPLSLLGSIGSLGIFFGLMVPILIATIFKVQSSEKLRGLVKNAINSWLLIILALNLLLLSSFFSYVSWLAIIIGVVFMLIFILSKIIRPPVIWTWLPMAVFVLIMLILMVGTISISRVNLPVEVSLSRGISWEVANSSIKDNFILGSGPATYGYDFSLNRPQSFNLNALYNLRFYQGTGIIFEALPSIGALGTFALALIILSFISISVYLFAKDKEKNKIYSLGLLAAAFIVLINIIIGSAEGPIILIGALVCMLALAVLLKESDSEESYLKFTLKASPRFALTLAFILIVISAGAIFLFIFVGKAYTADIYAGLAVRENQVTEEGSISKFNRAVGIFNKEGRYYSRLGQEYMVLANNEILKGEEERNLNMILQYLNNSIANSKRGADLMKNDAQAIEVLAQIYENAGLYVADTLKLAEEAYRRALELEPNNPSFYIKIGQIKMSQAASIGRLSDEEVDKKNEQKELTEEAKGLFEESISKKENFAPGYFNLALAQNFLGETDEAIENMNKAFSLDRSSVNYAFNLGRLYQVSGKDEDLEKAETLFREILKINDKEINTIFNLGLLLEETGGKDEAIAEYRKALDLIPDNQEETRERVKKMISNAEKGIKNTPENIIDLDEEQFPGKSLEEDGEQVFPTEDELMSPE